MTAGSGSGLAGGRNGAETRAPAPWEAGDGTRLVLVRP